MHSVPWRPPRALLPALALLLAVHAPPAWSEEPPAAEATVPITLLHLNDVYQFEPVDEGRNGGLARVATLRKQVLAQTPHLLFTFGGDTISPSAEAITTQGKHMVEAWNALGLDLSVLGNHEFDMGPEVLRQRLQESRFTWLGANVVDATTGAPFGELPPFVIREVGGVRVGVVGLLTPETQTSSSPGKDVAFQDVCKTASTLLPQMRAQGAQVLVGLTHMTLPQDKALAACAPFDLILGGHEHSLLMASSSGTPILKSTSDARELMRVTLNVGTTSGKLHSVDWEVLPVTSAVPEDAEFAQLMRSRYGKLLAQLSKPVGRTRVCLDAGSAISRNRETNLGSFLADALRRETKADVAILNGGSIRADASMPPGTLTERDVLNILPFKSNVVVLEVSGEALRQALENGVSRSAEDVEPGRFPQVSGLRFTFDVTRPAGSRVVSLTVGGQALDAQRTYVLATNAFMAGGGNDYTMLKEAKVRPLKKEIPIQDVLRRALAAAPKGIAPKADGRVARMRGAQPEERSGFPVSCPISAAR
jgi:5'-nucleotidase